MLYSRDNTTMNTLRSKSKTDFIYRTRERRKLKITHFPSILNQCLRKQVPHLTFQKTSYSLCT